MKITRRLLVPTLIFIAIVITALISFQAWNESRRLARNEEANLDNLATDFYSRLEADTNLAVALAIEVANNAEVQETFAAGDRDALRDLTLPAYQQLETRFDIPQYQFHLPPATSFLRLHQLDRFGDDLSGFRQTVIQANENQEIVSGLELGRGGLGLRGVVPVSYQGEHIGSVEFGSNLDLSVLQTLKENYGADWQILLRQDIAEIAVEGFVSDVPGPIPQLLFQASTFDTPIAGPAEVYTQALSGEPVFTRNVQQGDASFGLLTTPLYDFSGQIIGVVDILVDRTAQVQQQATLTFTFILALVASLALVSFGLIRIAGRVLQPIGTLTEAAEAIAAGDHAQTVRIDSPDELGILANSFNKMTEELRTLINTLEERVEARTQDLAISAEVSRSLSTIMNPTSLVAEVVQQVRDAFNYYHVHIYLLDEQTQMLRMAGGTGSAGQEMLAAGHKLAKGQGLVGRAAALNMPVLVPNVSQDEQWLPNPLLPDTKAETAVPIAIGPQVLGVLDVQHNVVNGLNEHTVDLLQSIANQIAIALENARLLESVRQQAEVETQINDIGRQIQETTSVEAAMQVAIRELGRITRAKQTSVQLTMNDTKQNGHAKTSD